MNVFLSKVSRISKHVLKVIITMCEVDTPTTTKVEIGED